MNIGKLLILAGVILIVVGIFISLKISIPFLGRLPGDISIKGGNYQVYIPITTSILLSILISLILYFLNR